MFANGMGSKLKSSQVRRTRFTENQKDYLSSKVLIGEKTGQKVDAVSVAKSMMTAMGIVYFPVLSF